METIQLNIRTDLVNSRRSGKESESKVVIRYSKSDETYVGIRFIQECCSKLKVECLTSATASCLFHAFFREAADKRRYDQYLIASACIYLAGKSEEQEQLRIRESHSCQMAQKWANMAFFTCGASAGQQLLRIVLLLLLLLGTKLNV